MSTQNQEIKCTECRTTTEFSAVSFDELCGDERLNFVKINATATETCPHCGCEMEMDVTWWQRIFPYKAENGETFDRVIPLWFEDDCEDCSVDDLSCPCSYYSFPFDYCDLTFNFTDMTELLEHLYESTKDPALLPIKETLKEKFESYNKMGKETDEEWKLCDKFESETIESIIPELKRIIDSHDAELKDPYMPGPLG